MKKQPIDNHPVDQFMQSLDAKAQPLMNESHWDGMQALLDQNFPPDEDPSSGAPQSDSRPGIGAAKELKRFKWIFLGGLALIMTMAGTQWSALAFQNSERKRVREAQENSEVQEESSSTDQVDSDVKKLEYSSNKGAQQSTGADAENSTDEERSLNESDAGMLQVENDQEPESIHPSMEKQNQSNTMVVDSVPGKKQIESVTDSTAVKKKKFIFW